MWLRPESHVLYIHIHYLLFSRNKFIHHFWLVLSNFWFLIFASSFIISDQNLCTTETTMSTRVAKSVKDFLYSLFKEAAWKVVSTPKYQQREYNYRKIETKPQKETMKKIVSNICLGTVLQWLNQFCFPGAKVIL